MFRNRKVFKTMDSSNQSTMNGEITAPNETNVNKPSISLQWFPNGSTTSVLTQCTFQEQIDRTTLKRLIQSRLTSSKTYREMGWEADKELHIADKCEKTHLTDILGGIKNGLLRTTYNFSSRTKIGRVYVKSSYGFVALRKHIRYILAGDKYVDIDIENAHPTIISLLFEDECKLSIIPEYVANRNTFFENIANHFNLKEYLDSETNTMVTIKDQCKRYISALFFGAGYDKLFEILKTDVTVHPTFVYQIHNELTGIYKKVIDTNPWLNNFKKTKKGERGLHALFSLYIQEHERRILETVFMHLCKIRIWSQTGSNDGSLCYDGLMITKDAFNNHPTLVEDIISKVKKEHGFDLKFTVKPMEVPIENINILNNIHIDEPSVCDRTNLNDIEDNFNRIVTEFEKSHFKILRRGMYGSINPDTGLVEVKSRDSIINMWRHISIGKSSVGTAILFIHKWLDGYDKIHIYNDIDIYPYPRVCPENHYNLWSDFEIERRVPERTVETMNMQMGIIKRFRKYLLVLVNGVKEHRDWLERWIAHSIQLPGEKIGKCIIFIGKEGSGKTTLVNILRRMMGKDRVRTFVKPERDLFGDFNAGVDKCYIVNLNETQSAQTSGEFYDLFKALITDDTIDVNTKNKDVITVSSYHRIIVTTNNSTPITQADRNDRRFVVFRTSDELCGPVMKKTFWVDFVNDIVNNDEAIRTLYDWYKYDWSNNKKWNTDTFASEPSPVTEYQKELREFSQKPIDSFLIDTANNDDNYTKNQDEDITFKEIYDCFCSWAKKKELRHIPSDKKFSMELSCLNIDGIGEKKRKRDGYIFVGWNWRKIRDHYGVSFIDDDDASNDE